MPLLLLMLILLMRMMRIFRRLPLTVRALQAQRRNTDSRHVLQPRLVLFLPRFLHRQFALAHLLVALLAGFHGRVDAGGGVDGSNGGETCGEEFVAEELLSLALVFRGRGKGLGVAVAGRGGSCGRFPFASTDSVGIVAAGDGGLGDVARGIVGTARAFVVTAIVV